MSTGRHLALSGDGSDGRQQKNTALGRPRAVSRKNALHRVADGTQCATDPVAQEQERDDGNDCDESEDECVFSKALTAIIVAAESSGDGRKRSV